MILESLNEFLQDSMHVLNVCKEYHDLFQKYHVLLSCNTLASVWLESYFINDRVTLLL